MSWEATPIAGLYVLAAAAALAAAGVVARERERPGGPALVALLVAAAWWAAAAGAGVARAEPAGTLLAVRLAYVGAAGAPVAWVLFAWRFTGRVDGLSPRLVAGLAVVPAATVASVLVSPALPLFWTDVAVVPAAAGRPSTVDASYGPVFSLYAAYSTLLVAAGAVAIGRAGLLATGVYRSRGVAMLLAVLAPAVAVAALLVGVPPAGVDPTPLGFVASGLLLAGATARYGLLDVPPASRGFARDTAIEELADGLLVLTESGVVTDCNPAAAAALDVDPDDALGRPLADLAPDLAGAVGDGDGDADVGSDSDAPTTVEPGRADGRIVRTEDDGDRHYDVRVSPFSRGGLDGRIVTLRDVTARHRHRRRLGVLNRVLRHDLRNEMNVVLGYADVLAERAARAEAAAAAAGDGRVPRDGRAPRGGRTSDDGLAAGGPDAPRTDDGHAGGDEAAERVREAATGMLELAEQVREVEATLDAGESPTTALDIAGLLEAQTRALELEHPEARVSLDAPESAWASASELVDSAFDNLLENAVVHNHRPTPHVDVEVRETDDRVEVTVADDGPGIPEQELATFRADGETALTHSSGFGLWLVVWLVEESGGDTAFAVDETGTAVTVRLPSAEPPE